MPYTFYYTSNTSEQWSTQRKLNMNSGLLQSKNEGYAAKNKALVYLLYPSFVHDNEEIKSPQPTNRQWYRIMSLMLYRRDMDVQAGRSTEKTKKSLSQYLFIISAVSSPLPKGVRSVQKKRAAAWFTMRSWGLGIFPQQDAFGVYDPTMPRLRD